MHDLWHISYNARSISYYTKHNDSYRPFIFPVVVKKALSSVKAERQLCLEEEKAFLCLFVALYLLLLSVLLKCCILLVVAFDKGKATTLHVIY